MIGCRSAQRWLALCSCLALLCGACASDEALPQQDGADGCQERGDCDEADAEPMDAALPQDGGGADPADMPDLPPEPEDLPEPEDIEPPEDAALDVDGPDDVELPEDDVPPMPDVLEDVDVDDVAPDDADAQEPAPPPVGGDYAVFGGLDVTRFEGAEQRLVTSVDDSGPGSLREALAWAAQRGQDGQYSRVVVSGELEGRRILLLEPLPRVSRTWIEGQGVQVLGAIQEPPFGRDCTGECVNPPNGFMLGDEVLLEGFVIGHFYDGVQLRGDFSAVWLRHNTFLYCANEQIDASDSRAEQRYLTISHNRFEGSVGDSLSHSVLLQNCQLGVDGCQDDPTNFFVSMHHNLFRPRIHNYMPIGGVKLVFYNNYIDNPRTGVGVVLMRGIGQAFSRYNIFREPNGHPAFVDGAVDSQGDFFEEGAIIGLPQSRLEFAPAFEFEPATERDVIFEQASAAGAPD